MKTMLAAVVAVATAMAATPASADPTVVDANNKIVGSLVDLTAKDDRGYEYTAVYRTINNNPVILAIHRDWLRDDYPNNTIWMDEVYWSKSNCTGTKYFSPRWASSTKIGVIANYNWQSGIVAFAGNPIMERNVYTMQYPGAPCEAKTALTGVAVEINVSTLGLTAPFRVK